jgi:hypothetical protein
LFGKPAVERNLGRPGPRWEGNIKMVQKYSGVMWIIFFTFRIGCVMGFCEYDIEPSSSVKGEEFRVA